jgi:hypothetical protein
MKLPGGRFEAVIEGIKGVVSAGQTVRIVLDKYEYSWKIESVSSASLKHKRLDVRKIK